MEACGERNAIRFRPEGRDRRGRRRQHHPRHRLQDVRRRRGFRDYGLRQLSERLHGARNRASGERLRDRRPAKSCCATARKPKAVGIIHCVGSRDAHTNRYCSRVCCMYSLKLAHLLKERTGAEVFNFYIDMRTPGKGYEEFYQKLLARGRPLHPRQGGRGHRLGAGPERRRQARDPRRGHAGRRRPPHSGGHGGAVDRTGTAGRRRRCAPHVQHQLLDRMASSWNAIPSSRR